MGAQPDAVQQHTRRTRRAPIILVLLGVLASCTTPPAASTPLPTAALIPAEATATPTVVPPTRTPAQLPRPEDLVSPSPETSPTPTSSALIDTDPIAAEMVTLAQRQLADQFDLPTRRIQLVDVQPFIWTDSSLGCPAPDQNYNPAQIEGYRIVLTVGGEFYIFHSDFIRVLPCPIENERLPDDTTPEPAT